MARNPSWPLLTIPGVLLVLSGAAISAQDKYTVQVPGGLSLSDCKGYEDWADVAVSHEAKIKAIVANSVMIDAYRAGFPGNGKPAPDGAKIMKLEWKPKKNVESPFPVDVPEYLSGVGCMVKDSKRFADSGGWGWGLVYL